LKISIGQNPCFSELAKNVQKKKREKSAFIYALCKYLFSTHYTTYIHLILLIFETEEPIKLIKGKDKGKVHPRTGHEDRGRVEL